MIIYLLHFTTVGSREPGCGHLLLACGRLPGLHSCVQPDLVELVWDNLLWAGTEGFVQGTLWLVGSTGFCLKISEQAGREDSGWC